MARRKLQIKRAYEPPADGDGYRILVDAIWPRGVRKEDLEVDWWARDLAPSAELRRWFGHDPDRWDEFCRRYFEELRGAPEAVAAVREAVRQGSVTLVYGARDEQHNQAAALREFLRGRSGS